MPSLALIAGLLVFCAAGCVLNQATVRWPTPLALSILSTLLAATIVALGHAGVHAVASAAQTMAQMNFPGILFHGFLAVLLFSGALFVDAPRLRAHWGAVGRLATLGVLVSAVATAAVLWAVAPWLGHPLPLIWCLVFGALIAPTDPIAVLALLTSVNAPQSLRTKLAGESLFNDATGLVLFALVLSVLRTGHVDALGLVWDGVLAPLLGAALGIGLALVATKAIARVDHHPTEILVTLALATTTWALAERLHISAPIAEVLAGLTIGARARAHFMSPNTLAHLDSFWETLDDVANAILFVLMGFLLLQVDLSAHVVLWGLAAWGAVLLGRLVGVVVSLRPTPRHWRRRAPGLIGVLSWAGLRGGLSLALALSLPHGPEARLLAAITFLVVALSSVVQGLSLPWVLTAHARRHAEGVGARDASFEDDSVPVFEEGAG